MSTKRLTTLVRSRITRGLCVAVLGLPVLWMTRFTAAAPKEPDGKADEQKPAVEMVHVSGVCRNEDGGPLKHVQLQLYRVDARILELSGTEISVAKTTSDGEGRF